MRHQVQDCPLKKPQIATAAATIQQRSQSATSTAPNEISSTPQSCKISDNFSPTPKTKGSSPAPMLDSSAEHLLVTTEVAGNLAKTLVDQHTAGADKVSGKFCTFHNLFLHLLQTPMTLQMTVKGSKSSISDYTKATIDWLVWSEERIFYVAALKHWHIILGSPASRNTKAVINMGTNSITIQPSGQQRFPLQPWITKPAQRIPQQKQFVSNLPQNDQLASNLPTWPKITK